MRPTLCASAVLIAACARPDPQQYLDRELAFLRAGVHIADEEREVRRVLSQRGLRVIARVEGPSFVALGAATPAREQSALRVITARGVVIAEDAAHDELFAPGQLALLESFGGSLGEYLLVASARVPLGRDAGCVTLHRLLPDGSAVDCVLDVGALGTRACVSALSRGRSGRLRAKVAWPGLYALRTPELEVELAFAEALLGQPAPLVPVAKLVEAGAWIEAERARLNDVALASAPFSARHASGVARAALALITGHDRDIQLGAYREAVGRVLPGSPEAEAVAEVVAHIQRGWQEEQPELSDPGPPAPEEPAPASEPDDALVIEPEPP